MSVIYMRSNRPSWYAAQREGGLSVMIAVTSESRWHAAKRPKSCLATISLPNFVAKTAIWWTCGDHPLWPCDRSS